MEVVPVQQLSQAVKQRLSAAVEEVCELLEKSIQAAVGSTLVSPDPAVALSFRTRSPDPAAVQLFTDVLDQRLLQETLQICEDPARKELIQGPIPLNLFQTLTKEEPVTFSLNALIEEPKEFSVGNKDQPEGLVKTEPEPQCILPVIKTEPEPEDLSPSPHQDLDHEPDQDFPQDSELSGQWQFEGLLSQSSDREHTENSSEGEAQSQSLRPELVNLSPKATLPSAQGLDGSEADADVTENSSDSNSPCASAATVGPSSVSVKLRPLRSDLVKSALSGQVAERRLRKDHDAALQAKPRVKLHKKRARAGGRAGEERRAFEGGGACEEGGGDRKFALQCLVKRHMKSHSRGEICGRSFRTHNVNKTHNRNETHNKEEPNRMRRRETKQPVKKKPNDTISYNEETNCDKLQNSTDTKSPKVKTKESKGKRRSAKLGATTSIRTPERVSAAEQRSSAACRRRAEMSREEQRKLSKEAANVSSAARSQVGSAPSNMCKLSAAASKGPQPQGTRVGVSNSLTQCKQTAANQRQSWGKCKAAAAKRRQSVGEEEEEAKRHREDTDTDKTKDSSDDSSDDSSA